VIIDPHLGLLHLIHQWRHSSG